MEKVIYDIAPDVKEKAYEAHPIKKKEKTKWCVRDKMVYRRSGVAKQIYNERGEQVKRDELIDAFKNDPIPE